MVQERYQVSSCARTKHIARIRNAAVRLLPKHNKLVSPEVDYLRRVLGERATQQQIDEKVLQVRKLPWSEIVHD